MRLLTGPAGSGKTARVLAEFRDSLQTHGDQVRLLVPTATLSEHLRNELARDGVVFRSRSVSTLAQWTGEVAPDFPVVDPIFFQLMVEDAVHRLQRPEFRKVCGLAGFHSRLARTISELDAVGCTPRKLARVRQNVAQFRDAIVAVWDDVERQLRQARVVTRSEQLRMITAKADSLPVPSRIWIDGFAQLSGPEVDLLCALGNRVDLTLTLPEEGVPDTLRQTLLERGFIEDRLTSTNQEPDIAFTVPETIEREAEEITRRIADLTRRGTAFRDIGVILRQPAAYTPVLRATFERFGIPAHFYFSEPLASHPAGRLFSGVIEALLGGWDHETLLALLRLAPLIGASDALDALEYRSLPALPAKGLEPLAQRAFGNRLLVRVFQKLQTLEEWRSLSLSAADWAARLERLPALFWPGYLTDHASAQQVEQQRGSAAGIRAFSQAVQLAADWKRNASPMRLTEFWRTAKAVLRLSSVGLPHRSRDVVHVISAYEARQWNLSAVFVCGLVEKQFPAQNGRDPFLSDAALRDLSLQGIRARTTADKDAEEQFLFDAACARARDLLVLSHPRTDSRGQHNLPSIFLRDRTVTAAAAVVRPALPPPIAQWRQPSWVKSEDLLAQLEAQHPKVSVTALESLLQCPFQFFAHRTLRVTERPARPEDRLDFLLQGNIIHDVLKDWSVTNSEIEPLFHETFNRICAEKNVQPGFRTERQRRALLRSLRRFQSDDTFPVPRPAQVEQPFALSIDPALQVSGKLDRIERIPDDRHGNARAVIIDYKFSRASTTKDKVEDETKLQGPLYAWAAREVFGLVPVAMLYISLKDEKPSYAGWGEVPGSKIRLSPMPPDWIQNALQRVTDAVAEFRSGVIHPRPANQAPCRYCSFKDACRVSEPMAIPVSGT